MITVDDRVPHALDVTNTSRSDRRACGFVYPLVDLAGTESLAE